MSTSATLPPPVLYSLRVLAESGYGSVETLRRAIREGYLEAVRVGGSVKVSAGTRYLRARLY